MIEQLANNPRILHQTADDRGMGMPELPIAACTDSTGLICLSQEGRSIVINRASVPELCKLLRELAKGETA